MKTERLPRLARARSAPTRSATCRPRSAPALEAHLEGCPELPRRGRVAGARWRGCCRSPTRTRFEPPAPQPPPDLGDADRGDDRRRAARPAGAGGAGASASPSAARPPRPPRRSWRSSSCPAAAAATPEQHVEFASLPTGVKIAATLEPHAYGTEIHMYVKGVRSGTLCRVFLRGPRRRPSLGRHLPLPLGRRLRRGAQLGARPLPHPGDRRPRRQPHLRRAGRRDRRDGKPTQTRRNAT